jgi:hypothetical protein
MQRSGNASTALPEDERSASAQEDPAPAGVALPPAESKPAADVKVGSRVAPKWWGTVDVVNTMDGKQRKVQDAEVNEDTAALMLARPSVRYRKTVNTFNTVGRRVAVNAQQYAVLVTNVRQHCWQDLASAHAAAW